MRLKLSKIFVYVLAITAVLLSLVFAYLIPGTA